MKFSLYFLSIFVFSAILSCGDSGSGSLEVYLSSDKAYADSVSSIDLEVKVLWDGKPLSKNIKVEFQTETGSFYEEKDEQKISVQSSGAIAKATLFAPGKPGTSKLTIIASPAGNTKLKYETDIVFETANASINEFNFSCEFRNFGALTKPSDAALNCDAVLFANASRQNKWLYKTFTLTKHKPIEWASHSSKKPSLEIAFCSLRLESTNSPDKCTCASADIICRFK